MNGKIRPELVREAQQQRTPPNRTGPNRTEPDRKNKVRFSVECSLYQPIWCGTWGITGFTVAQEYYVESLLAIANGTLRGIRHSENCYIVASCWTVYLWFGEVRGIMARGRAWWGAACAPLHPTLLYTHLSPSSLSFRLGTAVISKTYKHHLLLSRAYCRGQYFA